MNSKAVVVFAFLAGLSAAPAVWAHTVWLEPAGSTPGDYKVWFGGHDGKADEFPARKLKEVEAIDANGAKLKVTRTATPEGANIHVSGKPVLITAHFDNGVFAKTPEGKSVEQTMDKTPGATSAVDAIKYHKTIVQWTPMVIRPLGQPIEVIPMSAAPPRAGQPWRVQVRINGKPTAGLKLGRGEEKVSGEMTDANGVANFTPERGFNKLWAGQRTQVTGNPRYTELSYEYLLGFNAQ